MSVNSPANELPATISNDVAGRLRALRHEHPSLRVSSELIRLDENTAVVRVEILLPNGGSMASLGAADDASVETAENRALTRALMALGIRGDERPAFKARSPEQGVAELALVEPSQPAIAPTPEVQKQDAPPPDEPEEITVSVDDDAPLEDYSWTAFWQWARKLGYQNKIAVEELIGQSITSLNPAQVRNLLRTKTGAE